MGHKGHQKFSEEHGFEEKLSDQELVEVLESNRQASLKAKAREHTDLAVETLAEVAEWGKTDASRRSAARDILEFGHGKPTQQVHHSGGGGGITINILKFSDGTRTEVQAIEGEKEVKDVDGGPRRADRPGLPRGEPELLPDSGG
jgi:hypothetical protein